MEALHIIKKNPIKNIEDSVISQSKVEIAYTELSTYLERVKQTKADVEFKDHESKVIGHPWPHKMQCGHWLI